MANFPYYKQPDMMACGPTCLRMIAKHYGKSISLANIRSLSETTSEGSSLKGLSDAAHGLLNFGRVDSEVRYLSRTYSLIGNFTYFYFYYVVIEPLEPLFNLSLSFIVILLVIFIVVSALHG